MAKEKPDSPTHEAMRQAAWDENTAADVQRPAHELAVEYRNIDALIPYVNNARTHSDEQVAQIAASIKEFGWTNPVLVDGDNGIIAGHGRVQAARNLGQTEIPVIELHGLSDTQRRAYILADNQLAINAGWNGDLLLNELERLQLDDFDISITGFGLDFAELDFDGESTDGDDDKYTRSIEVPIYEITGKKPAISELLDSTKADELLTEIAAAKLPAAISSFLKAAATRHTVFDFANIAEYYAHSTSDIQNLMERSALVIIDVDKAIENGFVYAATEIMKLATQDADNEE